MVLMPSKRIVIFGDSHIEGYFNLRNANPSDFLARSSVPVELCWIDNGLIARNFSTSSDSGIVTLSPIVLMACEQRRIFRKYIANRLLFKTIQPPCHKNKNASCILYTTHHDCLEEREHA